MTKHIVFHGTSYHFEHFNASLLGLNVKNPTTSLGFFFAAQMEDALRWTNYKNQAILSGREQQILEVKIQIESPFKVDCIKFDYLLMTARKSTIDKFKNSAINAGHDGLSIEYLNKKSQDIENWYVPFSTENIVILKRHTVCDTLENKITKRLKP